MPLNQDDVFLQSCQSCWCPHLFVVPPHWGLGAPEGLCPVAKLSHSKNPVLASHLDHFDPHRSRHRGHAEENTGIGFCHPPRPCRPQDAADGAAGISRYHSESGEDHCPSWTLWECTALGLVSQFPWNFFPVESVGCLRSLVGPGQLFSVILLYES